VIQIGWQCSCSSFIYPCAIMSLSLRRPFLVVLALVLVSVFSACGEKAKSAASGAGPGSAGPGGGGGKGKGKGGGGPAPVVVGQVQKKIVPLVIEAIGAVEPIRSSAIRSRSPAFSPRSRSRKART
jgi:hypothetical protein